jgi:hypothetical protein
MELKRASRKQVKLRLNISAPSGAGKTYSALLMAKGLVGDWEKIAVIDTENESASLYSNLGDFNVINLKEYSPEKYIEAINTCVAAGMEAIILDSTTHEWNYLIEANELLAQAKFRGNTWSAWSQSTPRHDKFIQAVLQCPAHVITCTRSKTETVMGEDKKVKKVGMKDVQREGWEYELTVSLNIERDTHMAIPSKDRTNLFEGKNPFIITEATGVAIKEWCESGIADKPGDVKLREATTVAELANIFKGLSRADQEKYVSVKDEMKLKLSPPELAPAQHATTIQPALPLIPEDRLKKLMSSIKKDGADIMGVLKSAREQFTFTPEQEKEFTDIIVEKASKKQAA